MKKKTEGGGDEFKPRAKITPNRGMKRKKEKTLEKNMYFSQETQEYIVKYQQEEKQSIRDQIYNTKILPAFTKLVDNLVNVNRFFSTGEPLTEIKSDAVTFLFETIHKYDESKGFKAFSYFNIVAKNFLIIRTKKHQQKMNRDVYVDDPMILAADKDKVEEYFQQITVDKDKINELKRFECLKLLLDIKDTLIYPKDLNVMDTIIYLFEECENLDFINRNSTQYYIREMTQLSKKEIISSMTNIKKAYKQKRNHFIEEAFDEFRN